MMWTSSYDIIYFPHIVLRFTGPLSDCALFPVDVRNLQLAYTTAYVYNLGIFRYSLFSKVQYSYKMSGDWTFLMRPICIESIRFLHY